MENKESLGTCSMTTPANIYLNVRQPEMSGLHTGDNCSLAILIGNTMRSENARISRSLHVKE